MKYRPILFTPENAGKIHKDEKRQTRRVITPQPEHWTTGPGPGTSACWPAVNKLGKVAHQKCPFGVPGDRLWIREAWAQYNQYAPEDDAGSRKAWKSFVSGEKNIVEAAMDIPNPSGEACALYKADFLGQQVDWKWKNAMFMPRWACRTIVEITEVRVERVQDISAHDAFAEGVTVPCLDEDISRETLDSLAIVGFKNLWDSINLKTHPWSSNPWTWAITFKKV